MAKITGVEARVLVNHFRCIMEEKGYVFFEGRKPYDLNIVGVRSFNMRANKFDDSINVFYKNREDEVLSFDVAKAVLLQKKQEEASALVDT